ncbi:MAG: hypothetical protein HZC37_18490 [Burkholderiales bacterium]|nr:hypothetical protein [Burkholderiales bacterium]
MNTEALLALLIAAFYLKDSLLLLRADEAVLVRGLGGRWRAGFGARGFKLGGREPYLANPFAPHLAVFRLRWAMQVAKAPTAVPRHALAAPAPLAWLAPFAWVAWLLLFVAIPFTVLARTGVTSTLAALALLYADIAVALALLWRVRSRLGLGGRAYALLAFECLVCAPYAANLVRRAAAACPVDEDFTAAAARLLAPPALTEVHRECLARIDEQLEAEPEGGPIAQALARARARFEPSTTTDDRGGQ